MSYFHTGIRTIIGAEAFHGPVRDGKEGTTSLWSSGITCCCVAMQQRANSWSQSVFDCAPSSLEDRYNSLYSNLDCRQSYRVKPHEQLVLVSLTHYCASTPSLSTSWSRTTLQGAQGPGRSHLETSFPLRCFQRLSLPHIATRQCHWRDNRYTRGASTRSSRTRSRLSQILQRPRKIGDQTVSRRFKPSSRTSLNGEQPYPWDRLQPQDEMSRHRGAKHRRRYELLGGISLLSPEYLLSVERWPFHTEPPDHYVLLSPARLVSLAVKHAYAIALSSRCPTVT